jgi:hypothetical protein
MSTDIWQHRARWFAVVVGTMDFFTGVALVAAPAFTLRLMLVAPPGAEALDYVRFVGVFVGAVGGSYWLALARREDAALRAVFVFTTPFRLAAGTFVAAMVLAGRFSPAWLTVTAADWGIAAAQVWWLRRRSG